MRKTFTAIAAVVALGLGLAACETETPYQPLAANNAVSGGFTDTRLDDTHFRVSFQGNDATARAQVETYLLYRAAELTTSQGFDWFEMVDQHTKDHGATFVDPGYGYGYGYWAPTWRVHGRGGWVGWGGGWGGWGPYGPYWGDEDIQTIDQYNADAVIAVGHGPKPENDPKAFDAHSLMQNLGPKIVRPK